MGAAVMKEREKEGEGEKRRKRKRKKGKGGKTNGMENVRANHIIKYVHCR